MLERQARAGKRRSRGGGVLEPRSRGGGVLEPRSRGGGVLEPRSCGSKRQAGGGLGRRRCQLVVENHTVALPHLSEAPPVDLVEVPHHAHAPENTIDR